MEHSKLRPSAAERWLYCSKSVLEEHAHVKVYGSTNSIYAEEGRTAHAALSYKLEKRFKRNRLTSDAYKREPTYSAEMDAHATDAIKYISNFKPVEIEIETRVDLKKWLPGGFGTADAIFTDANGKLYVFDYKYGAGRPVSAENNAQLRLYGLGALERFGADVIKLIIYQPRAFGASSETLTRKQLTDWGHWASRRALIAASGNGEYMPSDDTCKLCAARSTCTARFEYLIERFEKVSNFDLGERLVKVTEIAALEKQLREQIKQIIEAGETVPGWELVSGRKNRNWTDDTKVLDRMRKLDISIVNVPSVRQIEKAVGKKVMAEFSDLISFNEDSKTLKRQKGEEWQR